MNLADAVIVLIVLAIISGVILNSIKRHKERRRCADHRCEGCAYKGFCGKAEKR